ncbi:MAG: TonB-dependent receptor plug domain-containing protein, partial [Pseudomonadota bacterium]
MPGRTLYVAIAAALGITGSAFADGRIDGKVTAADGATNLEGARVRIEELDRTVRTTRDGRFTLGNVPAGSYNIVVEYMGAAPTQQSVTVRDQAISDVGITMGRSVDEIIVRGTRSGTASSLNKQRTADNTVSVISADAIGALPDTNVAEALQRVPGVFLERDQGEGRYIGIRGIDPNLNVTTINGLLVPAPDSGARSVALDVIPSDLLEGLEVAKTFTPDMEASAIGGSVNVRSLSAFDRNGRSMTMTADASDNGLVEQTSPKLAITYTDTYDMSNSTKFGIAFGASWFDRDFGSDNIETDGGWPDDLELVSGGEFKGAEEIEQRSYDVNRERIGVALNLDWRTETSNYYVRNLYSQFADQEFRTRNEFKFDDGEAVSGNATSALWDDAVVEKSMKDRLEEQNILSTTIGGENFFEAWTIDYSLGYSMSEELEPGRLDTTFEIEDVDIGYASIGQIPNLTTDPAMADAANYELAEFEYLDGDAEDIATTLKLNFTYDLFSDAYNGNIKFGVLSRTREKTYDGEVFIYDGDGSTLTQFATSGP